MPKLDKNKAQSVADSTEMSGNLLLDEGRYAARLAQVEELHKPGAEFPYWNWEFEAIHDAEGKRYPGRQWNTTSLSPKSEGFMKASFSAFGYSPDSDTDEMIGEWVGLQVVQEVQTQGQNIGKLRNSVARLFEFDPDEWDFDPSQVPATPKGQGGGGGGASAGAGGSEGDNF